MERPSCDANEHTRGCRRQGPMVRGLLLRLETLTPKITTLSSPHKSYPLGITVAGHMLQVAVTESPGRMHC